MRSPHNSLPMASSEQAAPSTRLFIKVLGFTDSERHTLNTLLRLSDQRAWTYALWTPEARVPAHLGVFDGDSWEATIALADPAHDDLALIWVGDEPCPQARQVFVRPLQWDALLRGLDRLAYAFVPRDTPLDAIAPAHIDEADLHGDWVTTQGGLEELPDEHEIHSVDDVDEVHGADVVPMADGMNDPQASAWQTTQDPLDDDLAASGDVPRALVADPCRESRLYLRAKLAHVGITQVDEAVNAAELQACLAARRYQCLVLDQSLPGSTCWALLRWLQHYHPALAPVVLTGAKLSRSDAVRAWFAGAASSLRKPLDPGALQKALQGSDAYSAAPAQAQAAAQVPLPPA